jgi:hypothetical protein
MALIFRIMNVVGSNSGPEIEYPEIFRSVPHCLKAISTVPTYSQNG